MSSPHLLRSSKSTSTWYALAVALLLAATGAVAPHAQGRGGQGPQRRADRADQQLAERLDQGDGSDRERVIITLKPGAKRRLLQELQTYGERADKDFGVIEAVAGRLPRRMLRQLRNHPDVVAMSVDADVSPMSVAGVSGTAQGSPYSLRATLGLDTTFLGADSITAGATTSTKGLSVSSLSWSHTVAAGTNRILIVTTAHKDATKSVSRVTYGGVDLAIRMSAGASANRAAIYYMVNPPVGTATVVVTMSGAVNVAASARAFTGVDQVTPFTPGASGAGTSTTASVSLASLAGEVVLSAVVANGDAKTLTLSGTGTSLWNDGTGTASANVRGAAATRPGGGTVTVGWTLGASKPWGIVATTLRPGQVPVMAPSTPRTGAGVTVAVIDSGMLQDGGGTARIKTTRDFTTGDANPPAVSPLDGYGHGTHVAGLIGGDQAEAKGVAPGVSYVSLRVLDNYGAGSTSNVINAVQWAVANKATYGIDVINLSLGHPIFEAAATDPLVQAVEAAVRAGIVVVSSAGNMGVNPVTGVVGYAGISSPGNAPSAITVGAAKTFDTTSRTDDLIADYSSRGPTWYDGYAKPDVVAPGHRLLGPSSPNQTLYCLLSDQRVTLGGRQYLRLSGTSMAAAVTSGSVALMIEGTKATFGAAPTPNAVKAMLQQTAFPMADATSAPYHGLAQGAGALNPAGALVLAHAINPTAPVGSTWLTTGVTQSTTVDGQNIVWGENIVWGNNIVWGENIVWGNNIVWGENLLSINDVTIAYSTCGLDYY